MDGATIYSPFRIPLRWAAAAAAAAAAVSAPAVTCWVFVSGGRYSYEEQSNCSSYEQEYHSFSVKYEAGPSTSYDARLAAYAWTRH